MLKRLDIKNLDTHKKYAWIALLVLLSGLLLGWSNSAKADRQRLAADAIEVRVISDYAGALPEYPVVQKRRLYRAYIEAQPNDEYAIEVYNRTPQRLGLAIAVDGRNIISGRRSNLDSNERLYILGPYERAVYRGWRTDRDRVNRFYFTDAGDSYAAAWGDKSALGVIAVAAFREREYRHDYSQSDDRYRRGPSRLAPEAGARLRPGTGFGQEDYSPSRRVEFEPVGRAVARYFFKYEWRNTLCQRGIIDCYRDTRHDDDYNRFWKDRDDRTSHHYRRDDGVGFAPPPPRRY